MLKIKVGGVPEHFNFPWLKCIENNFFKQIADVQWVDCPGGTGEMAMALNDKKIDLAIMLTEGSIKEIEGGKDFEIIQKYIETPLLWGIHVHADSSYTNIEDLKNKTAAISRFNSGSHLMTHVLAENKFWNLQTLKFRVSHNLEGALRDLKNKKADYLLWERYTTKPFVDDGQLRHLGNCPTPWPCFVIVSRKDFLKKHFKEINEVLNILNHQTRTLKNNPNLPQVISQRYNLNLNDTEEWLQKTNWSQEPMKPQTMKLLKQKLKKFGIIS